MAQFGMILLQVGITALAVLFVALFMSVTVGRIIANRHRKRVPDDAWEAANVDRTFWGFWGIQGWVPFSDLYYLARIKPRLDEAAAQLDQRRGASSP